MKNSIVNINRILSESLTIGNENKVILNVTDSGISIDRNLYTPSIDIGTLNGVLKATNGTVSNTASINDLSDVTVSSPVNGHVIQYNGSNWVNAEGGGASQSSLDAKQVATKHNKVFTILNGTVIAVGYSDNKIYKSTNNGSTWDSGTLIASGAGIRSVCQLINGNLLAVGWSIGKVYKSTDNGSTWDSGTLVAPDAQLTDITQLANGDVLVSSYLPSKIYKSSNNGSTWDSGVTVSGGLFGVIQLSNGNILVSCSDTDMIRKSIDGGSTFDSGVSVGNGSGLRKMVQLFNNHILVAEYDSDKVYKSIDGGSTWDSGVLVSSGLGISGVYQLSNSEVVTIGNLTNKIHKSTDNGSTWDSGTLIASDSSINSVHHVVNYNVSKALMTDSSGKITTGLVTSTELGYLNGVTSAIQTQLNGKEPTLIRGNLTESTSSVLTISNGGNSVIGSGTSIQVKQASTTQSGYLSSTDWNTFNNKQNNLGYTPLNSSNNLSDVNNSNTSLNNLLPSQTGNADKALVSNGVNAVWSTIASGVPTLAVNQTSHGLSVGNVIRISGNGTYTKAKADNALNAEVVGVVITVVDSNNFVLQYGGLITEASAVPNEAAGAVLFLSDTTAGLLTATEPTNPGSISKPLAIIETSDTNMYWMNLRGVEIQSGTIDASNIADGSISNIEFQYLNGVTSNIQTQLNNRNLPVKIDIGTNSSYSSTTTILQNSIIERIVIFKNTAYSSGTEINISLPSLTLVTSTQINETSTDPDIIESYISTSVSNEGAISISITGSPSQGSGYVLVFYRSLFNG